VLDKAEYSAFESTLNSAIVSYRIVHYMPTKQACCVPTPPSTKPTYRPLPHRCETHITSHSPSPCQSAATSMIIKLCCAQVSSAIAYADLYLLPLQVAILDHYVAVSQKRRKTEINQLMHYGRLLGNHVSSVQPCAH